MPEEAAVAAVVAERCVGALAEAGGFAGAVDAEDFFDLTGRVSMR